jgi:hypothetical protein
VTPQPLPLFGAATPRPQRADLNGWHYDDACLLHDEKNPGTWKKCRVIGVSPRSHILTLKCEGSGFAIVQLQMPAFAHKLRRP